MLTKATTKIKLTIPLEDIEVNIPFSLSDSKSTASVNLENAYKLFSRLAYALAKLALPNISVVSSERDTPDLLSDLDMYATCTTLNVHPGVGDNIKFHRKLENSQIHFEQAPSFSRDPQQTLRTMISKGFNPLLARVETSTSTVS